MSTLEEGLERIRRQYASKWSEGHASHFNANGDYAWMASFLSGAGKVIEIGTGDGSGTIALCRGGSRVVSIENNPHCIDLAIEKLTNAGIRPPVERRGTIAVISETQFETEYRDVKSEMPSDGALILEGNPIVDGELSKWLRSNGPFDGIACWNIGSYRQHEDPSFAHDYRKSVEVVAYQMAHHLLCSRGLLHMVTRGRAPTDEIMNAAIQGQLDYHNRLTENTAMVVDPNIQVRLIDPLPAETGITLKLEKDSTYSFRDDKIALYSIVSRHN